MAEPRKSVRGRKPATRKTAAKNANPARTRKARVKRANLEIRRVQREIRFALARAPEWRGLKPRGYWP